MTKKKKTHKRFYKIFSVDFITPVWYKPNGKNPKSFHFSSLFRDGIKWMKIFYYALTIELYKKKYVQKLYKITPLTGNVFPWYRVMLVLDPTDLH